MELHGVMSVSASSNKHNKHEECTAYPVPGCVTPMGDIVNYSHHWQSLVYIHTVVTKLLVNPDVPLYIKPDT